MCNPKNKERVIKDTPFKGTLTDKQVKDAVEEVMFKRMNKTENYLRELNTYTTRCNKLGIPYDERYRMSQSLKRLYVQDLFPMSLGQIGNPILDVSSWEKIEVHADSYTPKGKVLIKVVWSGIDYGILVTNKTSHMGLLDNIQYQAFIREVKPYDIEITSFGARLDSCNA